jgi:hypothetical protein
LSDDGINQFIDLTFDAYAENYCTVSFLLQDASTYTSATILFDGIVDPNTLVPIVVPACTANSSTGQIQFAVNDGVNVNIFWIDVVFGALDGTNITQLPGGQSYVVVVEDDLCGAWDFFVEIVPVSPITYTIDQVTPVTSCTSQTVFAAGSIPGSISGTISGGSGNFEVEWTSGALIGLIDTTIDVDDVEISDTYIFNITDNITGCFLTNESVNVPSTILDLDITIQELSPMITNGDINAVGGPPANSIVVPGSLGSNLTISQSGSYNVDYTWSPAGGVNSNDGEYTSVAAVDDYIVAAQLNGSSCVVQSNPYSFSAEVCLGNPDLNWDGVVNGSDQLTLLGVFGLNCTCQADFNGDGVVNVIDLLIWINTDPFGDFGCTN